MRSLGVVLALAFCVSFPPAYASNSFLSMDAPTFEFSVEGMEYKQNLDVFVQQNRNVWVPLGELWFWAMPRFADEGIEVLVEVDDEAGSRYDFVMPIAGGSADFFVGENHIFVRSKVMHSDCFHGPYEIPADEIQSRKQSS